MTGNAHTTSDLSVGGSITGRGRFVPKTRTITHGTSLSGEVDTYTLESDENRIVLNNAQGTAASSRTYTANFTSGVPTEVGTIIYLEINSSRTASAAAGVNHKSEIQFNGTKVLSTGDNYISANGSYSKTLKRVIILTSNSWEDITEIKHGDNGNIEVGGDIRGGCPVFFRVWKSTDTIGGVNPIIWNETMVNKGSGYSTSTGKFTAPITGYYEFIYGGCSGRTNWSAEMHAHKNDGNRIVGASAYAAGGSGHWGRQLVNTMILELNVGDTFHLSQPGSGTSSQDMYGGSTYSYNFFSGKYLSN